VGVNTIQRVALLLAWTGFATILLGAIAFGLDYSRASGLVEGQCEVVETKVKVDAPSFRAEVRLTAADGEPRQVVLEGLKRAEAEALANAYEPGRVVPCFEDPETQNLRLEKRVRVPSTALVLGAIVGALGLLLRRLYRRRRG